MGLLTDPSDKDKLGKFIVAHYNKASVLAYLVGIIWFALLAFQPFNAKTYFSENALLPGLVARDYVHDHACQQFLKDLNHESKQHPQNAPFSWLLAKFNRLGLDVNIQDFVLHRSFGSKKKVHGKNFYAILRAPRAASTEALVLSTSYKPGTNGSDPANNAGIALMYSLASFFRDHTYWAKDIIFLITEHDLVGFQAWLDAYHQSDISSSVLEKGSIVSRSGSIQAAINLELHSSVNYGLDIKIEGLNGQLPNLDLFNLIVELCRREEIPVTIQKMTTHRFPETDEGWKRSLAILGSMIAKQASGVPSGAHGLFHRFGIQSLTIESNDKMLTSTRPRYTRFYEMGRVIEGVFRSLNNLLEKFHQSFFFYLLPEVKGYISIGMYMPPFALIAAPIILQAAALWLESGKAAEEQAKNLKANIIRDEDAVNYSLSAVIPIYFFVHCLGILLTMAPSKFDEVWSYWNLPANDAILYGMFSVFCSSLFYPLFLQNRIKGLRSWQVLKCITLLELGTMMFALAMMNFSLGLCLAVIYTPVCYFISPSNWRIIRVLKSVLLLLISPLVLIYLIIVTHTALTAESSNSVNDLLLKSMVMQKMVLVNSIEDGLIFGNWMYRFVCCFVCPTWLLLWSLLHQCFIHQKPKNEEHLHSD